MASTSTSDACAAGSDDLPVRVYIEHTDAYQVVYHSNYFKFLWRAREAYVFGGGMATALDNLSFDPSAAGWDHLDVVAIDDCKFAQSAVLGDDLLVRTTLVGIGEGTLAMRQEVVRAADGALMLAATVTVAPTDINGAPAAIPPELRGACASGVGHADPTWLAEAAASMSVEGDESRGDENTAVSASDGDGTATTETAVTLFESELSLGSTRGASDADVLRWFERDRTEAIGGADALSALKERDGVIVVVSGMDGFRCRPGNIRSGTSGLTVNNRRMAGVRVRSRIEMRRRNIQVAFTQRLFDEDGACVARAEVVCTCLSRDAGRPVKCPDVLLEKFRAMLGGSGG